MLDHSIFRILAVAAVMLIPEAVPVVADETPTQPADGTTVAEPCNFQGPLRGEECLIFVPENRQSDASRMIGVHFFRFEAREPSGLPPVFVLPGGPGEFIGAEDIQRGLQRSDYNKIAEIVAYNRLRDVIIVNQRGNSQTPGVNHLPYTWYAKPGKSSKPMSFAEASERLADGLRVATDECEALGIDLRGYDILHLVDDVEAIRRAYGYETIALRGSSFGSQWSFAYLKRWPDHVERMILAGVEPLDHGYDSAEGIWDVFKALEDRARESGVPPLPEEGLLGAFETIIKRLEDKPARVRGRHPRRDISADVVISADDFRHYLRHSILDTSMHSRAMLELWPKFVLEIYQGDYQYLASRIIDDRPEYDHRNLLLTLIDNSLGITPARERELASEPARRWTGDINWFNTATRDVTPTPVVSDEFRQATVSQIPVLMIHGNLDLATPIENARQSLKYFPNGHLITVDGGTHAATHHASHVDSKFLDHLVKFMEADDPASVTPEIPETIKLPALNFKPLTEPSLFKSLLRIGQADGGAK